MKGVGGERRAGVLDICRMKQLSSTNNILLPFPVTVIISAGSVDINWTFTIQ